MQEDRKYCVYMHTNPNDKRYIGITCQDVMRRWNNGHGYRHNPYFLKAIKKYGWESIKHEVLFTGLTKEQACEKEIELITLYNTTDENYGYNLSTGGERSNRGHKHSEESKRLMSELKKGENATWYGKKLSDGHRANMSKAHKGKPMWNEEQRKRISERQMGEKNHNYGKKASEGTKLKMRKSHFVKYVIQMTLDGKFVQSFLSTKEAAQALGCHKETIGAACRGKRKSAMGYLWKYSDNIGG